MMCEHWHRDHCNGLDKLLGELTPTADSDTISRAKAINALKNDKAELNRIIMGMSANDAQLDHYVAQYNQVVYDIDAIIQLPPAQPEPKRGRWIYKTDLITAPTGYWECSECKEGRLLYEENFCPHCGADMRGKQDG